MYIFNQCKHTTLLLCCTVINDHNYTLLFLEGSVAKYNSKNIFQYNSNAVKLPSFHNPSEHHQANFVMWPQAAKITHCVFKYNWKSAQISKKKKCYYSTFNILFSLHRIPCFTYTPINMFIKLVSFHYALVNRKLLYSIVCFTRNICLQVKTQQTALSCFVRIV